MSQCLISMFLGDRLAKIDRFSRYDIGVQLNWLACMVGSCLVL